MLPEKFQKVKDAYERALKGDNSVCECNLIVFQDGHKYLAPAGQVRAAHVLETLITEYKVPPTVAVFLPPGRDKTAPGLFDGPGSAEQRSKEYDALTSDYADFLQRDVLPFVERTLPLQMGLSKDPEKRVLCGHASGGLAAFNAAWWHPECFGGVISHCGCFVNIMGGDNFPYLIRTEKRKPLRVFLQSGKLDADIPAGNVAIANQTMAAALEYAGYDYRFEFGEGGHSLAHGGALFADTLQWVWRSGSFAGQDKVVEMDKIVQAIPKYKEVTQELIKSLANMYVAQERPLERQMSPDSPHMAPTEGGRSRSCSMSSLSSSEAPGEGVVPKTAYPGEEAVKERLRDVLVHNADGNGKITKETYVTLFEPFKGEKARTAAEQIGEGIAVDDLLVKLLPAFKAPSAWGRGKGKAGNALLVWEGVKTMEEVLEEDIVDT